MKKRVFFSAAVAFVLACNPANAAIVQLVVESSVADVFWPVDGQGAPFASGDSISVVVTYDTESQNFNEGSTPSAYEFVSLSATWGSYSFTSTGSPFGPVTAISSGIYIQDSADNFDRLSILDQSEQTGGGMVGDDLRGLALDRFSLDLLDFDGDGMASNRPPSDIDAANFDWINGRLSFSNDTLNGFVTLSAIDTTLRIVPIPAAGWLLVSGGLVLLGFCRRGAQAS